MLLLVEGFENYGTGTGAAPQPTGVMGRYYNVSGEDKFDIETGRLGGYSLEFGNAGCAFAATNVTTDSTLTVGFAVKFPSLLSSPTFLKLYDGATLGISLRLSLAGEIVLKRAAVILGTSAAVILASTWYYMELQVTCDNAAGTYELRLGGVNILSAAGVDTQAGANAYHDKVQFDTDVNNFPTWDDIYVCDSTGTLNNDFLGNSRVVGILPNGATAISNFGTSSPSANHFENVDENPCDDDTSYVEDSTSGRMDLYDYESMTGGLGGIHGLQIKTECRETDASNFDVITHISSGGVGDESAPEAIGTTNYVTRTMVSETDPNTAIAWTETGVNAARFGIEVG